MSQSGYTPILIYASGTATNVPLAANLTSSASGAELALNYADGKLYFKNSSGVVTLLSASGGGPAGGSNTQVQFNSSGVLAGSASFTWDGTTLVTPSHTTNTATTGSTNKGPLNYGTLNFSDTGIVQSAQTSVNSYFQNVIQNISAGTAASAEFIVYNDQGTAATNYATVGINSSGYTGTGSINAPGYAYFLSASTDLVLGTIGANGIHFTINSSATDALAISSAGAVSLPGGTANGVAYLNGSKVVTTGSALTFDGTTLGVSSGSSTPALKLYGAAVSQGQLQFSSTSGYVIQGGPDYTGLVYNVGSASYQHIWQINNSEQMRLTSTGLGIGTSSPSTVLDVQKATGEMRLTSTTGTNAVWTRYSNTGGFMYVGAENSTGTTFGIGTAYAGVVYVNGANPLVFATSGTERMRLDSSGNLLVGTTTLPFSGSVSLGFAAKAGGGFQVRSGPSNNDIGINVINGSVLNFYSSTAYAGAITVNGNITAYTSVSDYRLKENIQDAVPASGLIDAIQVRQYDWKSNGSHQRYGFVAQELVTVAPEAVHQPADPEQMMAVDYSKLVPMLVKEIQDLRKRLAAIEAK